MIPENIKKQIISIWDKYVIDNNKVQSKESNEISDIDSERIEAIITLKLIIDDFVTGKIDVSEFKTDIDSFNKKNNFWGFTSIKGQMFFNLLVKTNEAEEQQKKVTTILKTCITEPKDISDALNKIEVLEKFTSDIFTKAPDKRKVSNPGSVCYFLSYFWQIHNYKRWPIMYSSIIVSLTDIGLWPAAVSQRESYDVFFNLNEEIKLILSKHTGRQINNWETEHSFWNFRTITSSHTKMAKPVIEPILLTQTENNQPVYKASFNIFDYIIPAVANLITVGNENEKSSAGKGSLFEKLVSEIFKQLDFEVVLYGQGTGRQPDIVAKNREDNTAFIVDAKAYGNGYGLSAGDERAIREYIFYHCPKLIKEGYKKIGFIIVSNSFKTDFETFINDVTWTTDIKRFILLQSDALLHLLAFKNKEKLPLSSIIDSLISSGDIITPQDVIQKFNDV